MNFASATKLQRKSGAPVQLSGPNTRGLFEKKNIGLEQGCSANFAGRSDQKRSYFPGR
jgi:hypothetical protein